ncbi:hypothetical protein ACLKMY_35690 [Paraburkholderia mimosarum]|uniref:hypothetical protein n=1 Tax=Paraburkholderia mimosarum TaxID=312026 RepID=UPI0039C17C9C
MADPGFMIPLNIRDYQAPFEGTAYGGNGRNICSATNQATYTQAPWWTCENIQLTSGGSVTGSAVVGTTYVIQVGVQGLTAISGATMASSVENVEAWVCYPNTVAGGASATLVVPSMQNNKFASFSDTTPTAPLVFGSNSVFDYQNAGGASFRWINLSPWTPTQEDFLEESEFGGHCCIIANAAGQASLDDPRNPNSGEVVGVAIADNSQLFTDISVCTSLYQGQRNIMIVPATAGGKIRGRQAGLAFLSGAPELDHPSTSSVSVTAINQGDQVDPVLLKALSSGPYMGLTLKPASSPPRSLRLVRHEHRSDWLGKIVHEAEELIEELLGIGHHPFGGGHKVNLKLPPRGLQPLRMTFELEAGEAPGTVHAIDIIQTDADGRRGGIRVGVVVTN